MSRKTLDRPKPNGQAPKPPVTSSLRLDLACGQHKQAGFHGVDLVGVPGVDTVYDLATFPWPWADNSVEEIYSSHYVEHCPNLIGFMQEVWRICKPEAKVTIIHPYLKSVRAFQDPTHVRFIPEHTWAYFTKGWRVNNGLDHYPITTDFDPVTIVAAFNAPWHLKEEQARQFAIQAYWDVISDLTVTLVVKK